MAANQLRRQARRTEAALKKSVAGMIHTHRAARPKQLKGPAPRKLKIRA